jgi:2-polyprenyl-6-methoxyphenol hydroxylase-like FAD-dependent oxidoreductase
MSNRHQHAIVIGGSMTGLLTARVLTDHFERVTIIERDHLPNGPELRNGVPQARHLHVLLARGLNIMEDLFPGIGAELEAAGAPAMHWGKETATLVASGWSPIFESSIRTRSASRAFLEWHVRQRLLKNENIHVIEGSQVDSLVTTPDKSHVTGVQLRTRGANQEAQTLEADLVVDASGRGSHTPDWLESLGYQKPEQTEVNSFLGYSTRWYKHPVHFPPGLKVILIGTRPPDKLRGGGMMQVENDQWVLTLVGMNKDYPPIDEAGFLEFARSLLSPELYDAIKDTEPTSDISGYQRTANQLRHYEKLERWPDCFVALGDAVSAFNPLYGQGMTTGAMGAAALGECLRDWNERNLDGLAHVFQKRLAKVIEIPWLMATGEDLRYPGTEGDRPTAMDRLVQKYINRVIHLIPGNPDVFNTFVQVSNLLAPPTALFRPGIVAKVTASFFNGSAQPQPLKPLGSPHPAEQ